MQLSDQEERFMSYCGNSEKFADADFKNTIESLSSKFKCVLETGNWDKTDYSRKETLQTFLSLFLTATAKENIDHSSFCSLLYELNWSKGRIADLWGIYESKRRPMRWNLSSATYSPPHVVNIKWKLDYTVKNVGSIRSSCLCYVITLELQQPGGASTLLTFSCSLAHLTHFLTHLRQAARCIRNYASKSSD